MPRTDTTELLSKVPIFSELSKKELQGIAGAVKEVTHQQGAVLAREGESGIGFFLIVDGTARAEVGGEPRTRMGPGDFFGEISLLDGGPRTATVIAETPLTTLGLTQWVFKTLVENNPSIAAKLLKVMASRLRSASKDPTQ